MWYVLGILYQVDENVFSLTIGNDDADASLLHLLGSGVLRVHAAASEGALLGLDVL